MEVRWWPLDLGLIDLGLIGSGVRYLVTLERRVGTLTDDCLLMKGYRVRE